MKKVIWKYTLKVQDQQWIEMPKNAMFLTVQIQNEEPQLWALVDPVAEKEKVLIEIYGTGHEIGGSLRNYIGTFQAYAGKLVSHVFHYFGDLTPHP